MGLLDMNFPGNDTAEGQGLLSAAMSLLSAQKMPGQSGSLANALGQAGQQYMRGTRAARDDTMKRNYMQSQIDENASQTGLRKQQLITAQRQMEFQNRLMGYGQPPDASGANPQGAQAPIAQGQPQAGTNQSPIGAPSPASGGFEGLSRKYGVPAEALKYDMIFNGGKKISELIDGRSKPNWQNVNGNMVNTNASGFQGGMQAGLSSSADGKVTAWQPDGRGGLVVGAPNGALDTFRAYQGAAAESKPIKVYNPVTKREEYTNEGAVVGRPAPMIGRGGNIQSPAYSGGSRDGANAESIRMIQSELNNPALNIGDKSAMNREITRLQAQSPGVAAGPSTDEAASAKANETRLVGTASADVVRDTNKQKEGKLYGQLTAGLGRAIELLKKGPTASGFGSLVDGSASFFGKSTEGADIASQLETISGWLTSNVPRMEGPQSDRDTQNYRIMSAEVGDRTKPVSQRLAAATELQGLQAKYAKLNGGTTNTGGATGNFGDKPNTAQTFDAKPPAQQFKGKTVDSLPTPNSSNKGQRMRDTTTGKILVSNGLQWRAE